MESNLISVKEHIAYMHTEKKLELCYAPTYNMPVGLQYTYLNTSSLQKIKNKILRLITIYVLEVSFSLQRLS